MLNDRAEADERRTPNRSRDSFRSWPFVPVQFRADLAAQGANFTDEVRSDAFTTWSPPVDIHVDDERYAVAVELPGSRREDVSISLHENVLTVQGEKRRNAAARPVKAHRAERRYGAFERSFKIPADAQEERMSARYRDGVLMIEIPRNPGHSGPVAEIGA